MDVELRGWFCLLISAVYFTGDRPVTALLFWLGAMFYFFWEALNANPT